MLRIIAAPSDNFNERAKGSPVKYLVMHSINLRTTDDALHQLLHKDAVLPESYNDKTKYNVSSHYLIDVDGTVFYLVDEGMRAWHAGVSSWGGDHDDINSKSIGIEFVNPGRFGRYLPFTVEQVEAGIELSSRIIERHGIKPYNVVAHSDIAPERKEDPGHFFPWRKFAQDGIGLWSEISPEIADIKDVDYENMLWEIGYNVGGSNLKEVIKAFRRHFMGIEEDAPIDDATIIRIAEIGALYKQARGISS